MLGASQGLNPNDSDMPSYGTLNGAQQHEDQQVMGAQSTSTAEQAPTFEGTNEVGRETSWVPGYGW